MKRRIDIVTAGDASWRPYHMLPKLARRWEGAGHEVRVGPHSVIEGNIGLLHIDRTVVRDDEVPACPSGTRLLNGAVRSIAKSAYSTLLVKPDDDYRGPVIIKTDGNAGALPGRRQGGSVRRELLRLLARTPLWRWSGRLPGTGYPTLPSPSSVPSWIWAHDDLVVERFVPEREGALYAVRSWVFFLDAGYVARAVSRHPMVKFSNAESYTFVEGPPPALQAQREALGLDFGKIDFTLVDGETHLLDANPTPSIDEIDGSTRLDALSQALLEALATT